MADPETRRPPESEYRFTYEDAEQYLRGKLIPDRLFDEIAELEERPDLVRLALALDELHSSSSGTIGPRSVLFRQYPPREFGTRAYDLISRPGGIDELCEFIKQIRVSEGWR